MAETDRPASRRVFLALWPDSDTRQAIQNYQQQLRQHKVLQSATPVAAQNLHMTLHFIGPVSEVVIECLTALLADIECPSFDMKLDHIGRFPKPKILWLGLESIPEALDKLVKRTQQCVLQCVDSYEQKSFRPHITLFRKARYDKAAVDFNALEWRADRFVLVESKTWAEGVEYRIIKEWPLIA